MKWSNVTALSDLPSASSSLSSLRSLLSSSSNCSFRLRLLVRMSGPTVSLLPPPPVTMPPSSSSSSPKSAPLTPIDLGAWKYSDVIAVGMGGEYVRLMSDAFGCQPAARKAGSLRTEALTVIKRSPTPSLICERYAVRSWYRTKLDHSV